MSSRAALRVSGPGTRGRALTRPDRNRVFETESCNKGAFLQPRPACGSVMTPQSGPMGGPSAPRWRTEWVPSRRPAGTRELTPTRTCPHARSRQDGNRARDSRSEHRPNHVGTDRLAPASRHGTSLDRPTRDEHQHRRPGPSRRCHGKKEHRNTCFRVPTSRPSLDDPPRFGASGAGRWPSSCTAGRTAVPRSSRSIPRAVSPHAPSAVSRGASTDRLTR